MQQRIFVLALILSAVAWAQNASPSRGGRNYNPANEVTVTGTVEGVSQVAHQSGRGMGTHLNLKTESGVIEIHVGPTRYLDSQKFSVVKGDKITVTGSKLEGAIIAREIEKGDRVLTLRDKQGVPQWSGGRP